jgi:hypothetical protein
MTVPQLPGIKSGLAPLNNAAQEEQGAAESGPGKSDLGFRSQARTVTKGTQRFPVV